MNHRILRQALRKQMLLRLIREIAVNQQIRYFGKTGFFGEFFNRNPPIS